MRHYTTCCDRVYLGRLKVLVASMRRHCGGFALHVLAFDDVVRDWAWTQAMGSVVTCAELVKRHPELALDRLPTPRGRIDEKLCTWRWFHTLDVLRAHGPVTQLDSDLMFFSSPEIVFDEIGGARFAVNPHALSRQADQLPGVTVETHGKFGLFNGGWSYWADAEPLAEMAEYVRQWCHPGFRTHPMGGRETYGDQGYLELVQEKYRGYVIRHPGASPGPWNLNQRELWVDGVDKQIMFDVYPLVSFHYQGFRWAKRTHDAYGTNDHHDRILYVPYRKALTAVGDLNDSALSPCNECGAMPGTCIHSPLST